MLDSIKSWWKSEGEEIFQVAAVMTAVVTLLYYIVVGLHWLMFSFLEWTALIWVLRAWVVFSCGFAAIITILEILEVQRRGKVETDDEEPPRFT